MRITIIVTAAILLLSISIGFPQSLGDLARKERERREKIKNESKPITNTDAPKYKDGAITTASSLPGVPLPVVKKPKPAGAEVVGTPPDEPTDFRGRPESFWRQAMSDARQKVKDLENEANALTLKLAGLQTRFYAESDGFKQQQIQREIQKTIYEQDVNRENLVRAQARLHELDMEARKSGALPGWLTSRNQ
jgi:hypothetical protein